MKAAVVSSFDTAPRYEEFSAPAAAGARHGHRRDRGRAPPARPVAGRRLALHQHRRTAARAGHRRCRAGRRRALRYFVLPDTTMGSMAEQTIIDTRRSIVLPEDSDPIAVAAAMNPAMSSWVALRQRVQFQAGQNVLVLGATGNAGRMAVQIAKLFGAGQIIAAGRDAARLAGLTALGATDTVLLEGTPTPCQRLGQAAADVDVVIDYLWGEPTAAAMPAVVTAAPIAASRSPGSRSARSPGPPRRSPPRAPRRSPPDRRQRARLRQHP